MSRLALGTVQFGIPYGVANQQGQVSFAMAKETLKYARSAGLDTLDTAIAYGDSEDCLGKIGVESWQVISKLPELPRGTANILNWVEQEVDGSLQRLQIPRLYGLLLHCPQQLLGSEGQTLYNALDSLKQKGLVHKIGVSIYEPNELAALCSRFSFDLVQSPCNVLDRRLEQSGWLSRLKETGIEIHVRSIFLQGLLMMSPSVRPIYFERWHPLWEQWEQWLTDTGLTPLQACLGYALSKIEIDRVVVGVDCLSQLKEIVAATAEEWKNPPDKLCCDDPDLINPARWQLT
jgi:aryl-alcohol dehydrogenase-like predicted oxidoreductase